MLKNLWKNVLVLTILLFGCASAVLAQTDSSAKGSITVQLQSVGENVADRSVTILSWNDSGFKLSAMTDAQGRVTFDQVPAGNIDLFVVDSEGEIVAKAEATIGGGETEQLQVDLHGSAEK